MAIDTRNPVSSANVMSHPTHPILAVLIMLFTGWKGGEMVFRHRMAVYDEPRP
jgi:hypothetical protein